MIAETISSHSLLSNNLPLPFALPSNIIMMIMIMVVMIMMMIMIMIMMINLDIHVQIHRFHSERLVLLAVYLQSSFFDIPFIKLNCSSSLKRIKPKQAIKASLMRYILKNKQYLKYRITKLGSIL